MLADKPWLSVLMPTYNGERFLAQALDSVIAQNEPDIECIAVDDGSVDATSSILESYASRLPLRVVRLAHTGNWAANTNIAFSHARGEYVCILHQDDMWLKCRLSVMKGLALQHPNTVMFLNPSVFIDTMGRSIGLWRCPLPPCPVEIGPDAIRERLLIQNFISIPAPIVRREALSSCGGLDSGLWYTPDWDIWLKIISTGTSVYYPKPLTAFRIHGRSQTIERGIDIADFEKELEAVLDRHLRLLRADEREGRAISQAARFSIEANIFLAGRYYGKEVSALNLARDFILLGPGGWRRYLRDSRIMERVLCRLRSGLLRTVAHKEHAQKER